MIAASTYLPRTSSSTIAASSIHGTGAQNLVSALRNGCRAVSGTAFGPNFSSRRRASSLVRPVESGTVLTEDGKVSGEPLSCGNFEFALGALCLTSFIVPLGLRLRFVCSSTFSPIGKGRLQGYRRHTRTASLASAILLSMSYCYL